MANSDQFKKAGDAAQQAKERAGQLAHDNRDKFAGVLGKLASKIDERTQGKYHDKIEKAQDAALRSADKLAEQRPDGDTSGQAGPTAGDGQVPPPTDPEQHPQSGV